jgi:hypothetical protein
MSSAARSAALSLLITWVAPALARPSAPPSAPPVSWPRTEALTFHERLGVGFQETLGGVEGLTLTRGLSRQLAVELTAGARLTQRTGRPRELLLGGAVGAHFQVIRAADVGLLSVGLRYNLVRGDVCLGERDPCQAGAVAPTAITEHIFDLPVRVWWFINPYLSLHAELGLTLQLGAGLDPVVGEAPRDGYQLDIFQGRPALGALGLTLWL